MEGGQLANAATPSMLQRSVLHVERHGKFWQRHLRFLPDPYTSADLQRMTLAYFCLGALDLLGLLESHLTAEERATYTDWVYAQQLNEEQGGGFMPGPYLSEGQRQASTGSSSTISTAACGSHPTGNLAMTYTALLNLAILGDDFTRLSLSALRVHLRALQQSDGSFAPSLGQTECDCRFVYCAFAVCYMTDTWDAIDTDGAVRFILASRSYDGAFGQGPTQESHGGSTYCALSALSLVGRASQLHEVDNLRAWLLARQQSRHGGFNGRVGKAEDACYSFWCGASLAILDVHSLIDSEADIAWLLSCQTAIGGIAKVPGDDPDVMHSYLALAALALHAHDDSASKNDRHAHRPNRQTQLKPLLRRLDPRLNISTLSLAHLQRHLTPTAISS